MYYVWRWSGLGCCRGRKKHAGKIDNGTFLVYVWCTLFYCVFVIHNSKMHHFQLPRHCSHSHFPHNICIFHISYAYYAALAVQQPTIFSFLVWLFFLLLYAIFWRCFFKYCKYYTIYCRYCIAILQFCIVRAEHIAINLDSRRQQRNKKNIKQVPVW